MSAAGPGLAGRPARWPHEIAPDPVPDTRLPPLRSLEKLAARKAQLAEAALARARHARAVAAQALVEARQALEARVVWVASERQRLLVECQAVPDGGGALRLWREKDQALLASVPPCHAAVAQCERELEAAEAALVHAQEEHRSRTRRHEKFDLLIEQIIEDA